MYYNQEMKILQTEQYLNLQMMHDSQSNYYQRSEHNNSTKHKNKPAKDLLIDRETLQNCEELKSENIKLKKMLKEAQSKRGQITKQCSEISKKNDELQKENRQLNRRLNEGNEKNDVEKYRFDELKFLNKQLTSEIEELRCQNDDLAQKLRYSTQILQRKYEQMEEKTFKRIEQSMKRIKKGVHYLESLTAKQIEKTKEILIENLRKASELLRGKYCQDNFEGEIQELMNPLKNMQEQISSKTKEVTHLKQINQKLSQEIAKHKKIEKEHLPMYRQAIQKLKKNLGQVRSQLSQNEYDKLQIKKKYEQKLKESEHKYNELFKDFRKLKLQKKIYENKLQQMQADVEQEKERLIGENEMLKKLYREEEEQEVSKISELNDYKSGGFQKDKSTQQKKKIKKNYSSNQLKTSGAHLRNSGANLRNSGSSFFGSRKEIQYSGYNSENSLMSQQNLKNEICKIDEQIMQIQRNLTKQLDIYK